MDCTPPLPPPAPTPAPHVDAWARPPLLGLHFHPGVDVLSIQVVLFHLAAGPHLHAVRDVAAARGQDEVVDEHGQGCADERPHPEDLGREEGGGALRGRPAGRALAAPAKAATPTAQFPPRRPTAWFSSPCACAWGRHSSAEPRYPDASPPPRPGLLAPAGPAAAGISLPQCGRAQRAWRGHASPPRGRPRPCPRFGRPQTLVW